MVESDLSAEQSLVAALRRQAAQDDFLTRQWYYTRLRDAYRQLRIAYPDQEGYASILTNLDIGLVQSS
jgi:hypothetical protein